MGFDTEQLIKNLRKKNVNRGHDEIDLVIQILIAFGIGEFVLAIIGATSISHAAAINSVILLIFGGACLTMFIIAIVTVFTGMMLVWYNDNKKSSE